MTVGRRSYGELLANRSHTACSRRWGPEHLGQRVPDVALPDTRGVGKRGCVHPILLQIESPIRASSSQIAPPHLDKPAFG